MAANLATNEQRNSIDEVEQLADLGGNGDESFHQQHFDNDVDQHANETTTITHHHQSIDDDDDEHLTERHLETSASLRGGNNRPSLDAAYEQTLVLSEEDDEDLQQLVENDQRRFEEVPFDPPPPYYSASHTPEENPLIGEDDDDNTNNSNVYGLNANNNTNENDRMALNKAIEPMPTVEQSPLRINTDRGLSVADDEDDDDDDVDEFNQSIPTGAYDADEYRHMAVASDIKELFHFIENYHPQTIEIEPLLKVFILDHIPAVGDIDAFVKIPRPDEVEDHIGLVVLDEPAAKQSDPTILDMHMRAVTKDSNASTKDAVVVKKLDRADKNHREIDQWIANINELHKAKPATNVHYTKPMADIEQLMQEWPTDIENLLKKLQLPTAELDVSLEQFVDICLNLVDIPVHSQTRIQSLHAFFTLYSEFKNSQHFRNLAENNVMDNAIKQQQQPIAVIPIDWFSR